MAWSSYADAEIYRQSLAGKFGELKITRRDVTDEEEKNERL